MLCFYCLAAFLIFVAKVSVSLLFLYRAEHLILRKILIVYFC